MNIRALHIQHFRGFFDLRVEPKGHVAAMGEPGAGRSDLIEAMARVLDADASRSRIATELDFHDRDTSQPIQIALTLADLGPDLQQEFFDHLEIWDKGRGRLLGESETPEAMDQEWRPARDELPVHMLRISYNA